jgi:hypothetical protein
MVRTEHLFSNRQRLLEERFGVGVSNVVLLTELGAGGLR